MWEQLLPKFVGGMLIDRDAPDQPTEIVGFTVTDTTVEVIGKAFTFGGKRAYFGISAGSRENTFELSGPCGLAAVVEMPRAS